MQELDTLNWSIRRDISIQRAEYALKSSTEFKNPDNPLDFLHNKEIKQEVERIMTKASKGDSEMISSQEHSMILAFLAASLIYSNVQRPGVVQHMRIAEFQ